MRPWTQRYPAAAPAVVASGAPNTSAGSPTGGARYYSLHRAYGMTPDAAPIPPQFFGPTADLSTPETAETIRRANVTAVVNAARLSAETTQ